VQNRVRLRIEFLKFGLGVNMLKVGKTYKEAKKETKKAVNEAEKIKFVKVISIFN